jgi:hypothetical protein
MKSGARIETSEHKSAGKNLRRDRRQGTKLKNEDLARSKRQTKQQRKFQAGNLGAPPNLEREKQFLAGGGGKIDPVTRTQTETE